MSSLVDDFTLETRDPVPSDIDIAHSVKPVPIVQIAKALGVADEEIEPYGHYKAKVRQPLSNIMLILSSFISCNPISLCYPTKLSWENDHLRVFLLVILPVFYPYACISILLKS